MVHPVQCYRWRERVPDRLQGGGGGFCIRGWRWWRDVMLPGIFPYYVTGAITASGGAWNASIVSEAVSWGSTKLNGRAWGLHRANDRGRRLSAHRARHRGHVGARRRHESPAVAAAVCLRRAPNALDRLGRILPDQNSIPRSSICMESARPSRSPTGEPLPCCPAISIWRSQDGEILGSPGLFGSGKSTLLRIAGGLIEPTLGASASRSRDAAARSRRGHCDLCVFRRLRCIRG